MAALGLFVASSAQISQAMADGMGDVRGSLSADYDRYDFQGAGANQWNATGSVVLVISDPGPDIQVNFDNSGLRTHGVADADKWDFGGDAYWRDYAGDFGVNITENSIASGSGGNYLSGGFFGEFYAFPGLTLRAKGGRLQGDIKGWYADTGLVYYPLNQIAISMTGDYARFKDNGPQLTDGQISIEYLPVRDVPISISLNYTFARYNNVASGFGGDTSIFSIAVKAYFGGGGRNGGLVDYQRNGPTDWDGAPSAILGSSF